MHPGFDRILLGIMIRDKSSRIILNEKTAAPLMKRLQSQLMEQDLDLTSHLWFVSRLGHHDFLKLLALSDAFLVPHPFGAGITSSDALSMCTPIILLPRSLSVIQISLAQIKQLDRRGGQQESMGAMMIASDDDDYG
jgi:hypothetical protein